MTDAEQAARGVVLAIAVRGYDPPGCELDEVLRDEVTAETNAALDAYRAVVRLETLREAAAKFRTLYYGPFANPAEALDRMAESVAAAQSGEGTA